MKRYVGVAGAMMILLAAAAPAANAEHQYTERHCQHCRLVKAHFECKVEKVMVQPGHYVTDRIPARWELVFDGCGYRYRYVSARCIQRYIEPRFEMRQIRVWVPDLFICSGPPPQELVIQEAPPQPVHSAPRLRRNRPSHGFCLPTYSRRAERAPRRHPLRIYTSN